MTTLPCSSSSYALILVIDEIYWSLLRLSFNEIERFNHSCPTE